MKRYLLAICIVVLLPALAMGQDPDRTKAGRGYGFFSPGIAFGGGSSMGFLHFGGGGEVGLYQGLGLGAELGYLAPWRYMNEGVGMLSINGLYRFEKPGAKVAPFITGGYSLLFRSGHLNAINFGGGVDYWFVDRAAIRLEIRDHVSPKYFSDHLIQGRFGFVFR